ncbi:MAG: alpha-glucan family phosphorylase [Chthonomonadales bacterium]|nr:alpha-glucan family phosphorylase [Chthonomonadales bacterium]
MPEGLEGLTELAVDLRWSGSQATDRLWEMLDREAWERTNNPYMILQNVSRARLEEAARDAQLKEEIRSTLAERERAMGRPGWFAERHGAEAIGPVAYFSMEFGLSEALPIYSGGLGILAGDHLKSASDLGVPLVGIGLLYQQGYFRQILAADGSQLEAFPYNDPTSLPVSPVQDPDGGWLRIVIHLPGRRLLLRVWQARVGRVRLYLLDSNDPLNSPWDRGITSALYGVGHERRLIQEIVLGFGGWRALEELGIEPDVCHLNEGHAAFVVLARARAFMDRTGLPFPVALEATRVGNVFTTHTPVAAGFDRFEPDLIRQYAQVFAETVRMPVDGLLDLGRANPGTPDELLNMAYLAVRGCGCVNGVSTLHGRVSRRIFLPLFPGRPEAEVPVHHVTNGVHVPSWDSPVAEGLWRRVCNSHGLEDEQEPHMPEATVSDADLWRCRGEARWKLVEYVRRRLLRQVRAQAPDEATIRRAEHVLDRDVLTLGFARRFAPYKRPGLLLRDRERLVRILCDPARPVQLIVAGKAHPNDAEGKRLVQELALFAAEERVCHRVVFLADYDMALAQHLAGGVDVWINNPRRPWEACGTSGMKVLCNGGLNLSELDGWWDEAYSPDVGWALGDGREHTEPEWDAHEADELYGILEREVVPEFYDRGDDHLPHTWIARVRESMCRLTPRYSSYRMLREYVEKAYLPAAHAYRARSADDARIAVELQQWRQELASGWRSLRFADLCVEQDGDSWRFRVDVYLGDIKPDSVRVELFADAVDARGPFTEVMERVRPITGARNGHVYQASAPTARPAEHYTPRIVPYHPAARVPLEETHVLWQR